VTNARLDVLNQPQNARNDPIHRSEVKAPSRKTDAGRTF
jgi:hypothetical protein